MGSFVNQPPSQQNAQGAVSKPGEPWSDEFAPGPIVPLPEDAPPVRTPAERLAAAAKAKLAEHKEHKETKEKAPPPDEGSPRIRTVKK